jgi:hypothetical protein
MRLVSSKETRSFRCSLFHDRRFPEEIHDLFVGDLFKATPLPVH